MLCITKHSSGSIWSITVRSMCSLLTHVVMPLRRCFDRVVGQWWIASTNHEFYTLLGNGSHDHNGRTLCQVDIDLKVWWRDTFARSSIAYTLFINDCYFIWFISKFNLLQAPSHFCCNIVYSKFHLSKIRNDSQTTANSWSAQQRKRQQRFSTFFR